MSMFLSKNVGTAPEAMSRRRLSRLIATGSFIGLLGPGRNAFPQSLADGSVFLQDHRKIEQLHFRYAMAIDDRDPIALAGCYASGVMTSDLVEKTIEFHRHFEYTIHTVLNHNFLVQNQTATGSAYSVVSYVKNNHGKLSKFDTYARYLGDEMIKEGSVWRFSKGRQWTPMFSTAEIPVEKDVPESFRRDFKAVFDR